MSTSEDNERLIRIEQAVQTNSEQMAWMIGWLDKRFQSIDQRFQSIDQRFQSIDQRFESIDRRFESMERDLRLHIDLRHEEMRSDFRVFREMQKAQAEKFEKLEIRVEALEDEQRVMAAALRKRGG
jgi:hypothetical protein